jgi:soluble lytic murein transglycosylase-like protein
MIWAALLGAVVGLPDVAAADIVRLTNGRTILVEACHFEGDTVLMLLYGGGQIRAPRELVAELLPDEIPFARTVAIEALENSPAARGRSAGSAAIRALVDQAAAEVGIDRRLAHAVVRTESNYEPLAISPKGAMGLMQIMPIIARSYGATDPFDPAQNLQAGLEHLQDLLQRFDLTVALAAYNAGEPAVAKYGGVPPYRETQTYVRRILALVR